MAKESPPGNLPFDLPRNYPPSFENNYPGQKRQGETELILTPDEFLERIAVLVPPPRRHRDFSILAPNAPWRKAIIARAGLPVETRIPKQELETPRETEDQDRSDTTIPRLTKSHHGYAPTVVQT